MNDERNKSYSKGQSEGFTPHHTMTRWDGESVSISVGKSISEPRSRLEPIDVQFERMKNSLRFSRREDFIDGAGI